MQRMHRPVLLGLLALLAAGNAGAQTTTPEPSPAEVKEYILFSEIVRVAAPGKALDLSFGQGNTGSVKPDDVVWILDPTAPGLAGIACRPIRDTAKAGEAMGRLGGTELRGGVATHVRSGQEGAYVLDADGRLWLWRGGRADSLRVGKGIATSTDVDANGSGLLAVLWGKEVLVFLGFPSPPAWRFSLEADLLPAVGVAVSAGAEIVVAGRGSVCVAVYDLDANGTYRRLRSATAASLGVQGTGGVEVPPFMILPTEGKEAYVDQDRFVVLTDAGAGALLLLERSSLRRVGRWEIRGQIPGAAPGKLDVSNRGQIAFVDQRDGVAQVLPTRVLVAMLEGAEKIRWRRLEPQPEVYRVHAGDTLNLPPRK
ncbi:MAG TPA: hypothetical protein VFE28_11365 [Candidatus Krumholzibacteria bacterium]|nr:hypothetical protein [Candidatus Krumholzibacteria bacterium]